MNTVTLTQILVVVTSAFLADSYEDCTTPDVILSATLIANTVGTNSINFSWAFVITKENETICQCALSVRSFTSSVPNDFEDKQAPRDPSFLNQRYTLVGDTSFHIFTGVDLTYYHQFELRIQARYSVDTTSVGTYNHYTYVYYFGNQSSPVVIEPTQSRTVIHATVGDDVHIQCKGTGAPSPSVSLLKLVSCVYCFGPWPIVQVDYFSPVTVDDAGEYYCVATSILVNPPEGKRSMKDTKIVQLRVQLQVCQQYSGTFCSAIPGYSDGNSTVYVNRSDSRWGAAGQSGIQHYLENLLGDLSHEAVNDSWTPGCEFAVRQLLCHSTLPFCMDQEQIVPLMMCQDQCELLNAIHFCSGEMYTRLVHEMHTQSSKFFFQPDECMSATEKFSVEQNCMPSPRTLLSEFGEIYDQCYNVSDLGQSYTGEREVTQHGNLCQSWNESWLHFDANLYPELKEADNFCRNPGRLKERPWCFIAQDTWDYCNISDCTNEDIQEQTSDHTWLYYVIGVTVVIAVVSTILMVISIAVGVICYQKNKVQVEHIYDLPEGPPLPPRKSVHTLSPYTIKTSMNPKGDSITAHITADGACSKYENRTLKGRDCKPVTLTHQVGLSDHPEEAASSYISTQENTAYKSKLKGDSLVPMGTVFTMHTSEATSSHNTYEQVCCYERVQYCHNQLNKLPLANKTLTETRATACEEQKLLASNRDLAIRLASYEHSIIWSYERIQHGDMTTEHSSMSEHTLDIETKTSTTMPITQSCDQFDTGDCQDSFYEQVQGYERIHHYDLPIEAVLHKHVPQSASATLTSTDKKPQM